MLLNCDAGENSGGSLGQQADLVLKETNPEHSLEYSLKLKLQYSGHLMRRADSLKKTMMLGKIDDRKKSG